MAILDSIVREREETIMSDFVNNPSKDELVRNLEFQLISV